MILSAHLLAGAVVGIKTKKYWLIPLLAFVSHLALDTIPAWEYAVEFIGATNYDLLIIAAKASLDLLIGAVLMAFILHSAKSLKPAILGAFFGLLPDGFTFLYFLLKITFGRDVVWLSSFLNFHTGIQFTDSSDFIFWRIAAETIIAAVALFILWKSRRAKPSSPIKVGYTALRAMLKID